jgi:hypothetical protein
MTPERQKENITISKSRGWRPWTYRRDGALVLASTRFHELLQRLQQTARPAYSLSTQRIQSGHPSLGDARCIVVGRVQSTTNPSLHPQNRFTPVRLENHSIARVPASELPASLRRGDHTANVPTSGITASMPPPTPDFPARPTRKAKSPDMS